jgi:hypothetical protein
VEIGKYCACPRGGKSFEKSYLSGQNPTCPVSWHHQDSGQVSLSCVEVWVSSVIDHVEDTPNTVTDRNILFILHQSLDIILYKQ